MFLSPQKGVKTFRRDLYEQRAGLSIPDPWTWSVHTLPLHQPLNPEPSGRNSSTTTLLYSRQNLGPSGYSCPNSMFKSLIPHKHLPWFQGCAMPAAFAALTPQKPLLSPWSCKCLIPSSSSSLGPAQRTFLGDAVIFPEAKQVLQSRG